MLYCLKCGGEFLDSVKVCPDCGVALVDKKRLPSSHPFYKRPFEENIKAFLKTVLVAVGIWWMIHGAEGAAGEMPFLVGLFAFFGAFLGVAMGWAWARAVSSWKRLVTLLVTGLVMGVVWALVVLGFLGTYPAVAICAVLAFLSQLRWMERFRWPW